MTSAGLHKRPGQHTLHTRANTNTPHRVSRRAPGGPDPALARRDTMCCNYAISENSRRPSRALSTVTFILYFCKDLVPGCGWRGMGNRERKGVEDGQGGKRQEEGWMGRRGRGGKGEKPGQEARGRGRGDGGTRGAGREPGRERRRGERGVGAGAQRVPEGGASAQVASSSPSPERGVSGGAGETGAEEAPVTGCPLGPSGHRTRTRAPRTGPPGHACPRRARARPDSPPAPPPPPRPFQLRLPRLLPAAVAVAAPES